MPTEKIITEDRTGTDPRAGKRTSVGTTAPAVPALRSGPVSRLALDNWLTISAVARKLGISRPKVYGLLSRGMLACSRVGEQWLIPLSSIDALLCAQHRPAKTDQRRAS